ncbi:MAG: PepSY domain-containing protein, partial [Campylobacteraceae bacterium]|nr:PepSY domain-containing protein [Campylobacteraceae bacterium]
VERPAMGQRGGAHGAAPTTTNDNKTPELRVERGENKIIEGEQTIAANGTFATEPRGERGGNRTFTGEQTAATNRTFTGEPRGERGGNRTFTGERAEISASDGEPRGERGGNRTFTGEQAANTNRGERAEKPKSDENQVIAPKVEQSEKTDIEAQKAYDFFVKNIEGGYSTFTMQLPKAGESIFSFNYALKNPQHSRATNQLQVDMKTEEIVKHTKYDDKTTGEKFMSSIFALHSGDFFGIAGLSLYFISCFAVVLFTVTGYMLYYKRSLKRKFKGKKNK